MVQILNRIEWKRFFAATILLCLLPFMGLILHAQEPETSSHASAVGDCPLCGAELTVTVYPPTCSAQGYDEYICNECNEYHALGNYKDKLPHTWKQISSAKPTCTKSGSITRQCSVCNLQDTVENGAALGHNYESEVILPTCNSIGYTLHACTRCDDSYQDEETAKSDHTYMEEVITAPTCNSIGYCRYICTVCAEYKTAELPKVDHDWSSQVIEPTHTAEGYTLLTCDFCQSVNRESFTQRKPYEMVWTTQDATCTESGVQIGYCSDGCGHTESRVIPRLGHEYGQWETIRLAEEGIDGLESHCCIRCQHVETRTTVYQQTPVTTEPGKLSPLTVIIVVFLLVVSLGVTVLLFLLLLEHSGRERKRRQRQRR